MVNKFPDILRNLNVQHIFYKDPLMASVLILLNPNHPQYYYCLPILGVDLSSILLYSRIISKIVYP